MHLKSHRLLSGYQYGFRKAKSLGDILFKFTQIWASSPWDFGEFYAVALGILEVFKKVQHSL